MKTIEVKNIVPRASKRMKERGELPTNWQGEFNADILPGHSIRIFGTMTNHVNGPQHFDRVFKIGDRAVYDSYNLKYVGTIKEIGSKTITIKHSVHSAAAQLQHYVFASRNWNFDEAKIRKENSEWMD